MNKQLRDAYYDYLDDLARAGIIDHGLDNAVLEGTTVEQHIVAVLRAAGRLPAGWGRDQAWQRIPVPREIQPTQIRRPIVRNGYARLNRADLPYAS